MDAKFDEKGRLIPDNTPIEVPLKLRIPKSEYEKIAEQVSMELSRRNEEKGEEGFEESMDFDIDDDPDDALDLSPYEITEMQEEYLNQDRLALMESQQRDKIEQPVKDEIDRQEEAENAAQKEITE